MFDKRGTVEVTVGGGKTAEDIELAAIDAGASDVRAEDGVVVVSTEPADLHAVKKTLEGAGCVVAKSEITYLPKNTVILDDAEKARQVLKLIDLLEEDDDVNEVYGNFEIADAIAEEV